MWPFSKDADKKWSKDSAFSYLRSWKPAIKRFTDADTSMHSLKLAAELCAAHGYHPLFSLAYLKADARAIAIKQGSRHAYNERCAADILNRWQERIQAQVLPEKQPPPAGPTP